MSTHEVTNPAIPSDATENLLASRQYGPLYRLKEALFRRVPALAGIYAFNKTERAKWVAARASQVPPGARVIDIGAGSCPYRAYFSHCEYVAHDFGQLEGFQFQGRQGYGHLHLRSDITEIPAESGSFDVLLCTEVLEHVPEPIHALQEFGRLLKPDGLLLLSAPLRSALHQMPYHFYAGFTPSWYERFLPPAGFRDIRITPVCGVFNAYSEATLYLALYLSPFSPAPLATRLLLLPLWIALAPWLMLLCPVLCFFLDRLGTGKEFTVGYRVEARKKAPFGQDDSGELR